MKAIVTVAASVLCLAAMADKVSLKSGSFLTGKAGAIQDGKLQFESDDLGEIEIAVENIAALESDATHVLQYADLSEETVPLTIENGEYVVEGNKVNMDNVKAIDPAEETWHGSINVAFQSDRGNTYGHSATVLANVNRRWEKDRFRTDFGYYYGDTGTSRDTREKNKDNWELESQHDHFWLTKVYSYENARYVRDTMAGISTRIRLGAGLGYQWLDAEEFDSGKWSFNQEAGLGWTHNVYKERTPGVDDDYCSVHYAHHLTFDPYFSETIQFFHNLAYDPAIHDWEQYTIEADVGATAKVYGDFDLLAKIEWDYNSMPARGRKSSDFRYILGLGYKW